MAFSSLAEKVGKLPQYPAPLAGNATKNTRAAYPAVLGNFFGKEAELIEDIEFLIVMKIVHRLGMYWYAMIFLARWFKGFRGNARMSQITSTIARASVDLAHFGIIFIVLYVNFSLAGHVLFGSEVEEWSNLTKAFQSGLAMAWGRLDFQPCYKIAPVSSLVWLYAYVLSISCLAMNQFLAITMDHYGDVFHSMNAGDKGHGMIGQVQAILHDLCWNSMFFARYVYRILYRQFPKRVKKYAPFYDEEGERYPIPYEQIHEACERNPLGFTDTNMLMYCGCDEATAANLLRNCEKEVLRHLPEFYPLDELIDEFDESMKQYYYAMDHFSDELRGWFGEKSKFAAGMLPRQAKLDVLSRSFKTKEAPHVHVHKHHHRAHHDEEEEEEEKREGSSREGSGRQGSGRQGSSRQGSRPATSGSNRQGSMASRTGSNRPNSANNKHR